MTSINIRFFMMVALVIFVTACSNTADGPGNNTVDADNTARNERDNSDEAKTSIDQSEDANDVQISAEIRKAILEDDSLSLNAHNVKVITSAGVVTLRGPVKDAQEKATVEAKAQQVAGVTRVENLLEIEANP